MKIVEEIYRKSFDERLRLESEINELNIQRNRFKEDGDLSENFDYQSVCEKLEHTLIKYDAIHKMAEEGEPVPRTKVFQLIDVGSEFRLVIKTVLNDTTEGTGEDAQSSLGVLTVSVHDSCVLFDNKVCIAGETEEGLLDGLISTKSAVGGFLLGKSLGKHRMLNNYGHVLDIEAIAL